MEIKGNSLEAGNTIGVIAPSRPIYKIKSEIDTSKKIFEDSGYSVLFGNNLNKRFFYSAGKPAEKAFDLMAMFENQNVKAIFSATGGSSSNQILDLVDWQKVTANPKIFIGYSDITILLNAIHKKTELITFYGPDFCEYQEKTPDAQNFLFELLKGEIPSYPSSMDVIKPGKTEGKLVGGYLQAINALLASDFAPNFDHAILFWETSDLCPAQIDNQLNQLKLAGVFDKISGMIIGHLSDCNDKKYPEDNRPIGDIINDIIDFDFPIIKVDYFGHNVKNFYTLPIGVKAGIDTDKKEFKLLESAVK